MTLLRSVVARLMVERTMQGLSQRQAAARAGIDHTVIGRVERGQKSPEFATIAAYAQALGLDVTPHRPEVGDVLVTSGRSGTYQEIVAHLELLRTEGGESMQEVSLRAGRYGGWWKKMARDLSGPVLDTINDAAEMFGYRLALVPIREEESECPHD